MKKTVAALSRLGVAAEDGALPASSKRFPDGAQYRIEIPSVETPEALSAVRLLLLGIEFVERVPVPLIEADAVVRDDETVDAT